MSQTPKSTMESAKDWVVEHKLRTVAVNDICYKGSLGSNPFVYKGCLWLSGIAGSIAYNWSRPQMKTSVRIIHARLHAQAFTLAALAGAAVVEYFDHKNSQTKEDPYGKFVHLDSSHKN